MDKFLFVMAVIVALNVLFTAAVLVIATRATRPYDDAALRSAMRQLDADVDDLFERMKRLASRKGMQAKRDERQTNPFVRVPGETDAEWKARARKLRNQGVAPLAPEEV